MLLRLQVPCSRVVWPVSFPGLLEAALALELACIV